jgi:transcriptional regulator with XRE-family HTH domain
LSQEVLANAVGLTRTSITNIEHGRQPIQLHTLYLMANFLGIQTTDLLPHVSSSTLGLLLGYERLKNLSRREKEQLDNLRPNEVDWLQKIARSKPKKTRS